MVEVRKQDWGEGATREEGKGVPIRRGVGGRSQWVPVRTSAGVVPTNTVGGKGGNKQDTSQRYEATYSTVCKILLV